MTRFPVVVFVVTALCGSAVASAQDATRAQALIGLARSERATGHGAEAVRLFHEADRIQSLDARTLDEFFWTAADAVPRDAIEIGQRLLARDATLDRIRERLIEIARQEHNERLVVELAEGGVKSDPKTALWHRRIAESRLREGRHRQAAIAFQRAAACPDGVRGDAAQAALSLEAAGATSDAYEAWQSVEPGVWRSRREWAASRMRTLAAVEPPLAAAEAVLDYQTRFPGDASATRLLVDLYDRAGRADRALETLDPILAGPDRITWLRRESTLAEEVGDTHRAIRALSDLAKAGLSEPADAARRLRLLATLGDERAVDKVVSTTINATDACSTLRLEILDRLQDPSRLAEAMLERPDRCAEQARWLERAVARSVAAGQHTTALNLLTRRLSIGEASLDQRELQGLLLLWTGQSKQAATVLEAVLAAAPDRINAIDGLVDALRAEGRPADAWRWVERAAHHTAGSLGSRRLAWAEVGLEAHHAADALDLVDFLPSSAGESRAISSVRGRALVDLGRFAEARETLEPVVADGARPEEVLAFLDAVEATAGRAEAVRMAGRWDTADRKWIDVLARRALLDAKGGDDDRARVRLDQVAELDARRGQLLEAEIDLARARPGRALDLLTEAVQARPDEFSRDLYATALAESGDLDQALTVLAGLRADRPDDVGLRVQEADWRWRQSRQPEAIVTLEQLAIEYPERHDVRVVLASAYAGEARWQATLDALRVAPASTHRLSGQEATIAVTALEALHRDSDALTLLETRADDEPALALRRAQLTARVKGAAAAELLFSRLAATRGADANVYVAWADALGTGPEAEQVISAGTARFPDDARLQERLAIWRWDRGNIDGAVEAARRSLTLDPMRARARIVMIAATAQTTTAGMLAEVDAFEAQFGENGPAMLELADRLAPYAHGPDDPVFTRVLSWTERLAVSPPTAHQASMTQSRLLAAVGAWDRALDVVDRVLQNAPDQPDALRQRADLLAFSGHHAQAVAAYDTYLAILPSDLEARRLQARVEGWRQAYGHARARYREIERLFPDSQAVFAEAAAKTAYYDGRWREAIAAYHTWLMLEPANREARFELAQVYDRMGRYDDAQDAYVALLSEAPGHLQAREAYTSLRDRHAPRTSFGIDTQSSDGYDGQRLLSHVDSLARVTGSMGDGSWSISGGPSRVADTTRTSDGARMQARLNVVPGPYWRLVAEVMAQSYGGFQSAFAGGRLAAGWQLTDRLALSTGMERRPVDDNFQTLARNLAVASPTLAATIHATADLSVEANAARGWLSDDNQRTSTRLVASQRLLRGRHELSARVDVEGLRYRVTTTDYFSPANFWKEQGGLVYRHWLRPLRYSGDRESWFELEYLAGADSRRVTYQSAAATAAHDFASGLSVTARGSLTRSAVYDNSAFVLSVALKPFPHK